MKSGMSLPGREFVRSFAMTDLTVERFMAAVGLFAVYIGAFPRLFTFDRDPRDEPYINLPSPQMRPFW